MGRGATRLGLEGELAEEFRKFREALAREFKVERLILFGSRARGDHLKDSDIDLVIISPDFRGLNFLERVRRVARLWDGALRLEPLCYTPEEFDRRKGELSIVGIIHREGKEI
ncbi:MAG: nucleotidyltransferase domain-containing protein [Candidatus Acetothermia bacterium]|jgi:predicted nucleotidyltransferase|nr:nucleotidyltransferase domain-containing protein [Candidatus Acetothermia bacterium]MDH7506003.1 nucleotidyltransferase domain-containing protein [Candidatus Acetothermia bacterium]